MAWISVAKCKKADTENRRVLVRGEQGGNGMDWELRVSRCKVLYLECVSNEVLLYSIGNSMKSPEIDQEGGQCKKGVTCIIPSDWGTELYSRHGHNNVNQL